MSKVISIVNQKGGVGKTTTSINLAASLATYGKKVLLIDFDSQGNATTGVGFNKGDIEKNVYDVLSDKIDIKEAIFETNFKDLYLLPSSILLAGLEREIREKADNNPDMVINTKLKEKIDSIRNDYDFIIIDCQPSLGLLPVLALTASDSVIIPVQCEFYALEGITQLLNTIMITRKQSNPNLQIEGVLLTMLDITTNLGIEVVEEIKGYFKDKVYDTIIPRLIRLAEAPSHGKPIIAYDPKSKGSLAYMNLAKEVIAHNE